MDYKFELKLPDAKSPEYRKLRQWMFNKGLLYRGQAIKTIKQEYMIEYLKEFYNEQNK